MSEYGIKINNFTAGSIFEVAQGVRLKYDTTPAMLTNSLFKDFLIDNGLKLWKEESTRDIICIDYKYGSCSYDEAIKRTKKLIKENRIERKIAKSRGIKHQIQEAENRKHNLAKRIQMIEDNKDKYIRKTADELRIDHYINGVEIKYPKYNKKTNQYDFEIIKYKMLYRSAGKAKKGSVIFIKSSLWKKAHNFLWMGLKLPKKNAPIVEIGAYSSLIASSIEGRIKIDPSNILILKDVDSFFKTKVLSIELDENNHCQGIERDNYEVKNTIFDGQALIDESIFPDWGNGYVLLRHHFFKAAAFCTKIQKYFKDYFGDSYETATVTDMWGNQHLAKDIKLITTDQATKWLKFNVSYEYWSDRVRENGCWFGIVKTAHASKLGNKQRMSYQMVNSLNIDTMEEVLKDSQVYVENLKNNDKIFFDYLKRSANFSNDFEVLLTLCEHNKDFVNSDYFRERRKVIISNYLKDLKSGHIIQNADNLVIVGNPYGMLMHSVGENCLQDPTLDKEEGTIQCWTARFDDNKYLAAFRSPYNSDANLGYLHNHYHPYFDKYFNLGKQIICVNLVETDFQARENGSDQDSDQVYVTDESNIVAHAKYCYKHYPTVDNNIPMEKNIYSSDIKNFALIDNKIASTQLDIGESSNVAQVGLSYTYNEFGKDFEKYVDILAVLAQCSIDNTKRTFAVNIHEEIQHCKNEMNIKEFGYPKFFGLIKPEVRNKINPNIVCPMNEVDKLKVGRAHYDIPAIPINEFFINHENKPYKRKCKQVEDLIEKYSLKLYKYQINDSSDYEDWILLRSDYEKLIEDIRKLNLSNKYIGLMSWLINRAFMMTPKIQGKSDVINTRLSKNRPILLKILYDLNPKMFKKCFKSAPTKN